MIITTEILSVACLMNKEGMSYQNPTHMMLAINTAKSNCAGYMDTTLSIEGYYDFMKKVAESYGTKPEKAPIARQMDSKGLERILSEFSVLEDCEFEDWIQFFAFLRDNELDLIYSIAYAFKGYDFITPKDFLDLLEKSVGVKYVLPAIEIDENIVKVIQSVGISYMPKTIQEELAYTALYCVGVSVIQALPSLELNALVDYVPLIDHVMKTCDLV